jgi:vacuolar-type H+-ATPase subunit C/Vma6
MHSRLLTERDFESFIQARGVFEVLTTLENSEYGRQLAGLKSGDVNPRTIDSALLTHFNGVLTEVSSMLSPGDAAELRMVFLGEFDAKNISAVVGGILSGMDGREIVKSLTPVGLLDRSILEEASNAKNIEELQSIIPSYAGILAEAGGLHAETSNIGLTKTLVERGMLLANLTKVRGVFRSYLKLMVEALDMVVVFRCKTASIDAGRYVAGVRNILSEKQFNEILQSDVLGALKILSQTRYGNTLQDLVKNIDSLQYVNQQLDVFIDDELQYRAMLNPLSAYFILTYLKKKLNNVVKLRAILIGKHLGLSPEELSVLK